MCEDLHAHTVNPAGDGLEGERQRVRTLEAERATLQEVAKAAEAARRWAITACTPCLPLPGLCDHSHKH